MEPNQLVEPESDLITVREPLRPLSVFSSWWAVKEKGRWYPVESISKDNPPMQYIRGSVYEGHFPTKAATLSWIEREEFKESKRRQKRNDIIFWVSIGLATAGLGLVRWLAW